jgi:hypothetical protein
VTSVQVGASLPLDSGDFGLSRIGSSSESLTAGSWSDGRLSPSNSWMSGLATPRYGFLERVLWLSSCQ